MRRAATICALTLAATLVPAAPAAGHAFYVQVGGPGTGADCVDPNTPCPTINDALAFADDIVLVAPGIYDDEPANIHVTAGKVLVAQGVPSAGSHVIEPAGAGPALTVTGTPSDPAVAVGFTVQGSQPALVNGSGRLSNSFLGDPAVPDDEPYVRIEGGGTATVEGNLIADDGAGREVGIEVASTGSPVIAGNDLSGLWRGIEVGAGSPAIRHNRITGSHDELGAGGGVHVAGATAALSRNRLEGNDPAVRAAGGASVSMDSDLVVGGGTGIAADGARVAATNMTAFDNSAGDIALQNAALTLNSSIVEHPIAAAGSSPCAISFSAGPTTAGSPCEAFQVSNAGTIFGGDYQAQAGTALVDAGDPAAPPEGALDVFGGPRILAGSCGAIEPRRDIGADEYDPGCTPPPAGPDPGPGTTPPPPPVPARDTDPPASRIDKLKLDGRAALVRFSADEPVALFRCKLDGAKFKPCTSPKRYRRVDVGDHVFRVRAVDMAGNEEPGSARKRFEVKRERRR